ncbi:TetR/AcrR family transcriptional regulator [Actinomadura kijaniata]
MAVPGPESAPAPPKGRKRRRAGLDTAAVTAAAVELVDTEGLDALTMTNLARRLGVTQPALYAHVENLAAIQRAVGLYGMRQMSEELRTSVLGRSGDEALWALAETYRAYVRRHPDRYALQLRAPRTPEYHEAGERAAEAVRAVLRSYGLPPEEVPLAHHFLRASISGFVSADLHKREGGAPDDTDAGFQYFLENFADMLRRRAAAGR